ncbi:MAG: flagellar biosynthesis protein FliR [Pirellulaceae bacterium]|nr:MAG: flagellar biosynthesis protein FliR [Pirellulaceae bacterium]
MEWLTSGLGAWVVLFWLVLSRLGVWLMLAPGSASPGVPAQARLWLATTVSLLVLPIAGKELPQLPQSLADLSMMLFREILIGALLGLAVALLVSGLHLAGYLVAHVAGVQLADIADPAFDSPLPAHGKLFELLVLGIFFASGGHRRVLGALLDSFVLFPPGTAWEGGPAVGSLESVALASFSLALRLAAPVLISVLLATVVLGLISRTVPQLNILAMGFSLNGLVLLAALLLSLGSGAWLFGESVDQWVLRADQLWTGVATNNGTRTP